MWMDQVNTMPVVRYLSEFYAHLSDLSVFVEIISSLYLLKCGWIKSILSLLLEIHQEVLCGTILTHLGDVMVKVRVLRIF